MFTISNFEEIKEFIKEQFDKCYNIVDKHNCSSGIRIPVDGHKFVIMFTQREVVFWANDGSTSLFEMKHDYRQGVTEDVFDKVKDAITNWFSGYIHCSDCGKLIKRTEVAGGFFAGLYCKDCWEREWKEKEAQENYE